MKVLVTGGAGFIGSNLVEYLLKKPDVSLVRVMDNLSTGALKNIESFKHNKKFEFLETDIRSYTNCLEACTGVDVISHQAALGSVPRSIKDPLTSNDVNITGSLNIFQAAKENGVKRVVYAASSSTYGDHPDLPKIESKIGNPLSPYAVTKYVNELYAGVFSKIYGLEMIGLRYFNVFGPRQNPQGPYAAVIPLFLKAVLENESPVINGDGSNTRDFTYVSNAVLANDLALFSKNPGSVNQIYNIACGKQTSLNELLELIKEIAGSDIVAVYKESRQGDVKYSLADISKAKDLLDYKVLAHVREGLQEVYKWFNEKHHYSYS